MPKNGWLGLMTTMMTTEGLAQTTLDVTQPVAPRFARRRLPFSEQRSCARPNMISN